MPRYSEMSDAELAEWALGLRTYGSEHGKLIFALAKRLQESGTEPPTEPPQRERPSNAVEIHMERGLSREARAWLREHRPNAWSLCHQAKYPELRKPAQHTVNMGMGAAAFSSQGYGSTNSLTGIGPAHIGTTDSLGNANGLPVNPSQYW